MHVLLPWFVYDLITLRELVCQPQQNQKLAEDQCCLKMLLISDKNKLVNLKNDIEHDHRVVKVPY